VAAATYGGRTLNKLNKLNPEHVSAGASCEGGKTSTQTKTPEHPPSHKASAGKPQKNLNRTPKQQTL
jgi:hypothetical protein